MMHANSCSCDLLSSVRHVPSSGVPPARTLGDDSTTRRSLMLEPTLAEKARHGGLKAKRKMLFEEYRWSPRNTRLALAKRLVRPAHQGDHGAVVSSEEVIGAT